MRAAVRAAVAATPSTGQGIRTIWSTSPSTCTANLLLVWQQAIMPDISSLSVIMTITVPNTSTVTLMSAVHDSQRATC